MTRARLRADQMRDVDNLTEPEHDILVHENLVTSGTLNFQDGTISGIGDVYATTFYGDGSNLSGVGGGNPESLYYNTTDVRATATSGGLSITDGTATAATIEFINDDLYITNNDADGEIYITAEKTGTGQSTLFHADPDGAAEFYYAGTKTLETEAFGIRVTDGTDTVRQFFSGGTFYIRNDNHGGGIWIDGQNNAGSTAVMFVADPDGLFRLYHAGAEMIESGADGIYIHNGALSFRNVGGNTYFRSHVHGDPIRIEAENNSGSIKPLLIADPDGAAELYYAGTKTLYNASDGLYISDGTETAYLRTVSQNLYLNNEANGGEIWIRGNNTSGQLRNMMRGDPDSDMDFYYPSTNNIVLRMEATGISIHDSNYNNQDEVFIYWTDGVPEMWFRSTGETNLITADNSSNIKKTCIDFNPDSSVGLYYAGTKEAETVSDGLKATNSFVIASTTTVSGILDEDNMASDSDTDLATQQSIKAYVDNEIATVSGASTLLELTDTPAAYDDGKYLKSTTSGTEWATVSGTGGGLSDLDGGSASTVYTSAQAIDGGNAIS